MKAMREHVLVSVAVLALAVSPAMGQSAEAVPPDTEITRPLTESYLAIRAGRTEATALREQLALLMASPDATEALRWLAYHGEVLSQVQVNDLHAEFIRLNPNHEWAASEKENLARELFWNQPRQDRLCVYREVVGSGTLHIGVGFPFNRAVALSAAAREGMTELESEISTYRPELLWEMRLAKGAENWHEAVVLRGKRLHEMGEREFFDTMKGDDAFRALVEQIASYDCSPMPRNIRDRETAVALGRACKYLQSVVRRQEQYVKRLSLDREAVGGVRDDGLGSCLLTPTSWLERFAYAVRASALALEGPPGSPGVRTP
jgi:hypothetical protein